MRLSPLIPFALTNVVLAAFKVRVAAFFAGTVLGMLPRTALMAVAGAALTELDFSHKSAWWMIVAGIVVTLWLFVVMGRLARKNLDKRTVIT